MYSLYREKCADNGTKPVSARFYHETFVTCFNLGFGNPRTDVCAKCSANENNFDHQAAYKIAMQALSDDRSPAKKSENLAFLATFSIYNFSIL